MAIIAPEFLRPDSKFGDPFVLPSTSSFPKDIKGSLDLCLYLYRMNSLYGAVCNRVVSYFITDIEYISNGNKDERAALTKLLKETLDTFSAMQQAGKEWATYGNAFMLCVEPFDRWLIDDRDGGYKAIALSSFPEKFVKYNWDRMTYTVPDLKAASKMPRKQRRDVGALPTVELQFRDKPAPAPDRFSIVFLDPRYVTLDKAHHSKSIRYVYTIPPDMENRIKTGVMHEVNNTPRKLLEAVKENKDYRFHQGEVYHFRSPSQSGVSDSGWSCPEVLLHYDALYQLQIYRKADFAIAQDMLTPIRWFSPPAKSTSDPGGPAKMLNLGAWRHSVAQMLAQYRKDPTSIHALAMGADYAQASGDGKNMVLHDIIEVHIDALFDGLGFPRDLFRGAMQVDQLPNAIRMFERSYEWLYQQLNGMLKFIAGTVQRALDTDELEIRLKRPVIAYNAEWMQLKMQLAANREIPRADVYPDIGIIDPENAAERAINEDQELQRKSLELQTKFEKEKTQGSMADVAMMAAEQAAQGQGGGAGAPGAGGAAGGGPGGQLDYAVDPNGDPSSVEARAQEVAASWLQMHQQQPNSHRKEMQKCEAINPTLWSSAKAAMEKMRSEAGSAGRAQAADMVAQQPPA